MPLTITGGFNSDTARGSIFTDLKAIGSPWSDLIISNSKGAPVRALQPVKSMDLGVFPKDQMATYIAQVVSFYEVKTSNRLIFNCDFETVPTTWTGYTQGNTFIFAPNNNNKAPTYPRRF